MTRRGWWLMLAAAVGPALVSLASDVTTSSQVSAEADALLAVRLTVSKLVNAGTVWAGLAVLSGWLVRRPAQAVAAGIVAGLVAARLGGERRPPRSGEAAANRDVAVPAYRDDRDHAAVRSCKITAAQLQDSLAARGAHGRRRLSGGHGTIAA